jgi:hypothetical protein
MLHWWGVSCCTLTAKIPAADLHATSTRKMGESAVPTSLSRWPFTPPWHLAKSRTGDVKSKRMALHGARA